MLAFSRHSTGKFGSIRNLLPRKSHIRTQSIRSLPPVIPRHLSPNSRERLLVTVSKELDVLGSPGQVSFLLNMRHLFHAARSITITKVGCVIKAGMRNFSNSHVRQHYFPRGMAFPVYRIAVPFPVRYIPPDSFTA